MSATKQRLVVIGNGMAAGRVVEELVTKSPDLYDITIFGAEPRVNYDRILLSPVLARTFADVLSGRFGGRWAVEWEGADRSPRIPSRDVQAGEE